MIRETIQRYHQRHVEHRAELSEGLDEPMRRRHINHNLGIALKTGGYGLCVATIGIVYAVVGLKSGFHDTIIEHTNSQEVYGDALKTLTGFVIAMAASPLGMASYEHGATAAQLLTNQNRTSPE